MNDMELMDRALSLARQGAPAPNPYVGAVICKGGRIIGEGFHRRRGEPHAEINALKNCTEDPAGATLAVTLEPCCHNSPGKLTPPCSEAIIAAGIDRVIVGTLDPNIEVSGGGVKRLKEAGIEVLTGIRNTECRRLNRAYNHHRLTGRPLVHLKIAQTLDGFAARPEGGGKITGEEVQRKVHVLRANHQAILTGSGTVLTDDPRMDVRHAPAELSDKAPLKIILNSGLNLPADRRIFSPPGPAWLIGTADTAAGTEETPYPAGVEIIRLAPGSAERYDRAGVAVKPNPCEVSEGRAAGTAELDVYGVSEGRAGKPSEADNGVELEAMLEELGRQGIISVLTEAGPTLTSALLKQNLADEITLFIAISNWGQGIQAFTQDKSSPYSFLENDFDINEISLVGDDLCISLERKKEAACLQD
jgi:diaminohydroxyphosphoribosylaminopyrimidine deaminase/5-amino-6-(5-phosphoribosylamino)uracil reductase